MKLIVAALMLFSVSAIADEAVLHGQQTYKCFTDEYEPGMFYQVTFGQDDQGRLAANDFRYYGESITGEIYNEHSLPSNIRPQILGDGSFWFTGLDYGSSPVKAVELNIKRLETEIKWQLMTGKAKHGETEYYVTCAYIGVKPPKH